MANFRERDFYEFNQTTSILQAKESSGHKYLTPLESLFEDFEISSPESFDSDFENSKLHKGNTLKPIEGPYLTTVDYNAFSPIRQMVTPIEPYSQFQIVTTYELCPLARIIKEIEEVNEQMLYYFSKENLLRDIYLRSLMNSKGFIAISIFSNFPRIKKILNKLPLLEQRSKVVKNALKLSEPEVFELFNDTVRLRKSWKRWVL
ncbi:protein SRO9 [Kluyveromyces marxianus]|uniref:Protein SRO9 n=1 Tax=Kluyveromyces marxianus TaxID=4911 RepID=A0ABX6EX77_KLUMA|nr:protein SRO9 [Kluyveromyces marxianus]